MSQHSKNILHFITHIINIRQCTTVQTISRHEYDNNIQLSQKEMLLVRSITNVLFFLLHVITPSLRSAF